MAPTTRSATRYARGEFCKYVMEQPTVMELIVQHIEQPRDIIVLKAVFKSERCIDAINKCNTAVRVKYFYESVMGGLILFISHYVC